MAIKAKYLPKKQFAKKAFDAVKMMRDIRNKIDKDIEGMSFEEQKAYIKLKLSQK